MEDKIVTTGQQQSPYQIQVANEAGIERKRQPQTFIPSPVSSTGLISATLLRSRIVRDAYDKQAKFFSLLEEKYGAVKGDDRSYLEAMDRYHNDKDMKKQESKAKTPFEKLEEIRLKQEKKAMKREEEERMRREEEQRHQREYDERMRQEQYRKYQEQPGWEQWNRHEERRKQQEWERFKQQQQQQQQKPQQQYQQYQQRSYAYGGPAPEPGPLPSSRDKGDGRYPTPNSRAEALIIMGLDPHASLTARDIKLAFNKKALLLHPDKNLDNREEAGEKFKQLDEAFKYLRKQEGGRNRKHRSMSSKKNKKKSSRKAYIKASRKNHKKSHKKISRIRRRK